MTLSLEIFVSQQTHFVFLKNAFVLQSTAFARQWHFFVRLTSNQKVYTYKPDKWRSCATIVSPITPLSTLNVLNHSGPADVNNIGIQPTNTQPRQNHL